MSNKPNTVVTLTFGTVKANRVLDAFAALLNDHDNKAVSYTHLTLPTNREV